MPLAAIADVAYTFRLYFLRLALLAHGRRPPEKGSALPLYYTAVSPDERDSLVLQRASEDRWLLPFESEEETDDECEHRTPTPTENEGDIKDRTSPSRLHSAESPSTSGSPSTSFVPISDGNIHNKPKRRKTSHSRYPDGFSKHTQFDYVPTHLPPLPGVEICEQPLRGTESTQATDAEYARERALYGSAQKKMRAEAEGPEVSSTLPELVTTQSRRVLRNVWREAIPYTDSMLGEVQPASDVPTLHEATSATSLQAFATTNSSLRAFAASYGTLQEDPTSSAGAGLFLTPAGNAHADVAAKRRRLAAAIADPNRYHPSDTLYGAVAVRPSSVPFIPGPSLLITTSATSAAPVFTPVRPHGRPVALIPPAGALVPALGYRHPAHIAAVSRLVAPPDLLRRVARAGDPPPLYDDKHAERVFQGAPAPRELLNGGYSALAPALAELARSTAPSVPNNDDGQEREDDRKPSAGTLVHTWDWHVRDYVDAALPGRRLRA